VNLLGSRERRVWSENPFMTLSHSTDRIESERLALRRIDQGDFEFFAHLHTDPDVARYLSHGKPRSSQETIAWLQSVLQTYEDFALGQLAVLRKSDGMLIGRCGLSDLAVEARATVAAVPRGWYERELGYTFHRSSWGQGYASEAARCVFDYARDVLRLPRMISLIHPENLRSFRVAQRFGVQREDVVQVLSRPFDRFAWPIQARR
jgi:ribosomal-protein-alanine N-acetyltransferase